MNRILEELIPLPTIEDMINYVTLLLLIITVDTILSSKQGVLIRKRVLSKNYLSKWEWSINNPKKFQVKLYLKGWPSPIYE